MGWNDNLVTQCDGLISRLDRASAAWGAHPPDDVWTNPQYRDLLVTTDEYGGLLGYAEAAVARDFGQDSLELGALKRALDSDDRNMEDSFARSARRLRGIRMVLAMLPDRAPPARP